MNRVLVIGATGTQGSHVCDELLKLSKFQVYGTSREANNPKLQAKGVTPLSFQYGDRSSIDEALKLSQASIVFFLTVFAPSEKFSPAAEIKDGTTIVDACKDFGVKFVVYSSAERCDVAPEEVGYYKSKAVVENHLKESGVGYGIVRPGGFFENINMPHMHNPLTKGHAKGLFDPEAKIPMIAAVDIARAAVAMIDSPESYQGSIVTCVSVSLSGKDVAKILSKVSGVECTYSQSIPKEALMHILPDLYHMVEFYDNTGLNPESSAEYDIFAEKFKKVVPNPVTYEDWFKQLGQWSDGEKFL